MSGSQSWLRFDMKSLMASSKRSSGANRRRLVLSPLSWPNSRPIRARDENQVQATRDSMPTLFRFVITLCILAALGYGAMLALVILVEPNKGEMSERIPSDRINLQNR